MLQGTRACSQPLIELKIGPVIKDHVTSTAMTIQGHAQPVTCEDGRELDGAGSICQPQMGAFRM